MLGHNICLAQEARSTQEKMQLHMQSEAEKIRPREYELREYAQRHKIEIQQAQMCMEQNHGVLEQQRLEQAQAMQEERVALQNNVQELIKSYENQKEEIVLTAEKVHLQKQKEWERMLEENTISLKAQFEKIMIDRVEEVRQSAIAGYHTIRAQELQDKQHADNQAQQIQQDHAKTALMFQEASNKIVLLETNEMNRQSAVPQSSEVSTEAIQNAEKLSEAESTVHKHQVALIDAQKMSRKQLQEAKLEK